MTRRTALNINALILRAQWMTATSGEQRAAVRHFAPCAANKLDGVITVCPEGVAVVPEWMV